MPTCSAQTPIDGKGRLSSLCRDKGCRSGFTLTELIIVILILGLFIVMAQTNLFRMLRKGTFKAQASELVTTLQMAASAAAESDRRYEVIIDLTEQSYTLREITSTDLTQVLEEEIIIDNYLNEKCQIVYVLFDDLIETDEDHQMSFFRAGHAGWQNGGKIVLLDEDEQPYTIVVNRLNRIVTLKEGDIELLMPKTENELPF